MARRATKRGGKGRARRVNRTAQILGWILAPPLAYVLHPTIIVAIGGMIPTWVAYIVDNRPQRYAARTVGYANAAGVVIVAMDMWLRDHTWQRALELISDPLNWAIMFGAAALGWALYFALPPMMRTYLAVTNELKLKQLKTEQRELINEWGLEVTETAREFEEEVPDAAGAEGADEGDEAEGAASERLGAEQSTVTR